MGRTLRNFENKPLTQNNDIVGVYNARKNSFEQFTDYYPYGMPHASISSEAAGAEVNRRKFGGKELMSDHGYNSYDFAARHQNPAFPHFTTPDQMAETKPWNSGYLYCGGDPINFIDPTGLDEYEFDNKGVLVKIYKNDEYDIIHILDINGKRIPGSKTFNYGTIKYCPVSTELNSYDYFEIENDSDAKEVFEFVASNTSVEWGIANFTLIQNPNQDVNIITTSHETNTEGGMMTILDNNYKINSQDSLIDLLQSYHHSHPSNNPFPSGILDNGFIGDMQHAELLFQKLKYSINLRIYLPRFNKYIWYDRNATFSEIYHYNHDFEKIYTSYKKSLNIK